ncbi:MULTISPECIES: OmpA family protein [unclassified Caballeronia]|uniref:OmpA family protein n=1 Tax=unclassified Caballeronia TaxID=2646786 RepID=UPI00285B31DA|nr:MULTISPECIES: OmpA family protein [unclassified Caballeronia]MDR5775252.1 OmpA family protein [Caballeronia sp. LZ002]MDR5850690.1 OmpA family protein [Caballeronia sp. LZ003]
MSINLVQAVRSAITDQIAEQLSQKFGIPAQIVQQLAARAVPGLVASLMERSAFADGANALYTVVMSPDANAFIADQLSNVITTTSGLKHLEASGHLMAARATGQRIDALTDAASIETGVPAQATSALSGMLSAVLFGVLKHYFLLSQVSVHALPALLRDQVAEIRATLSNGIAAAIGLGNTEGFASNIAGRLDAVGATLEPALEPAIATIPATAAIATATPPAPRAIAPIAPAPAPAPTPTPAPASTPAPAFAAATTQMRAPVRKPAPKKSHKWIWLLFAMLAAILAAVYYRGFTNGDKFDLRASTAASPVTQVTPAASSVDTQVNGSDALRTDTASATTIASSVDAASGIAAASVPDAAPAKSKDASLLFHVSSAGVPSIEATVATDAEKQRLIDALEQHFGKNYSANVSVDAQARPATWLSHVTDLLPLMAVPGAEAKIAGSKVELSGTAAEAKFGWMDRLKTTFGDMFQVSSFNVDSAVANATQSFRSAMKTLLAAEDSCSGDKLSKVLDLQVVNFGRSSATVPQDAYATLDQTAALLKDCAAKGSMVKLEVAGYSDATGVPSAKLEMSRERAQAVRGYLMKAGVPSNSLTSNGYGDANPIADNATASGRFANRRIEFVVK